MADERKVARLDLSDFKPKPTVTMDMAQDQAAIREGERLGFTGRGEIEKIDGRTLRRKGKRQMNMRITPAVQHAFRLALADFPDADACLDHLLSLYQRSRSA